MSDGVRVERGDGVVKLLLDDPRSRNSLSIDDFRYILDTLKDIDPRRDRCIVVASSTPGSFCSGLRLGEDAPQAIRSGAANLVADEVFRLLSMSEVPTLAAIDGPAYGGGCELALRCDMRIASARATFAIPATRLGLPYAPATFGFLVRRYGQGPIGLLFLAGARIDAAEAARLGLVQRTVERTELETAVEAITNYINEAAPLVTGYTKVAIATGEGLRDDLEAARQRVIESDDFATALRSISERRQPRFDAR